MSYEPNRDFQSKIYAIEDLIQEVGNLRNIEVPYSEDIDSNVINKELSSSHSKLENISKSLLNDIAEDISIDFDNAASIYMKDILNYSDDDIYSDIENFPYLQWSQVIKSESSLSWKPVFSWLNDTNNFIKNTEDKKKLYFGNIVEFMRVVEKYNLGNARNILTQLEKKLEKENLLELYNHFVFKKNMFDLFNSSSTKESNWNTWTTCHLINHWSNLKDRTDLLMQFKNVLDENPNNSDTLRTQFIDLFLSKENSLNNLYEKTKNYSFIIIKSINWEILQNLMELDNKYELGLSNNIIKSIETIVSNSSKFQESSEFQIGYKSLLNQQHYYQLNKKIIGNNKTSVSVKI